MRQPRRRRARCRLRGRGAGPGAGGGGGTTPAALEDVPVARLATIRPDGSPRLVPICFVLDGKTLFTAVDEKPKRTRRLARLADIEADPRVEVLIDRYDADWSRLEWVRLRGTARVVERDERALELLQAKYPQYRDRPPQGPFIVVEVEDRAEWRARG